MALFRRRKTYAELEEEANKREGIRKRAEGRATLEKRIKDEKERTKKLRGPGLNERITKLGRKAYKATTKNRKSRPVRRKPLRRNGITVYVGGTQVKKKRRKKRPRRRQPTFFGYGI